MVIVKAIELPDQKVWIEQHNEFFILKYQEKNKEVMALNAIQNLTLILEFFEKLVGKHFTSN